MRKPKSERKRLIEANDALFRQIIRNRDVNGEGIPVCQKTDKKKNLQVCHFYRRNILRTRWDEENACLLNAGVHIFWAHSDQQGFREWWLKRLGQERFDNLELRARYAAPVKREYLEMTNKWLRDMLETKKEDICK